MSDANVSLVVEPNVTLSQLDRLIDDFYEAVDYFIRTGFASKVRLVRFSNTGKPVYERMEND